MGTFQGFRKSHCDEEQRGVSWATVGRIKREMVEKGVPETVVVEQTSPKSFKLTCRWRHYNLGLCKVVRTQEHLGPKSIKTNLYKRGPRELLCSSIMGEYKKMRTKSACALIFNFPVCRSVKINFCLQLIRAVVLHQSSTNGPTGNYINFRNKILDRNIIEEINSKKD